MAQYICSIGDCTNRVQARTWCSTHYGMWRRWGSPAATPLRVKGRMCSVPGCGQRAGANDLCPAHYLRARRSGGDPGDVIARPGVRQCWWCEAEFTAPDLRQLYCSTECASLVKSLWNVSRLYGITRDDYRAVWYRQGGLCAICGQVERTARNRLLSVDHDHDTGEFRGLLCSHCNRAIGLLMDDPAVIEAAARYVRQTRVSLSVVRECHG